MNHRVFFFEKYQFLHPSDNSHRLSAAKMNIIYGAIFEEEVEVVVDESDAGEATTYYFTLVLLLQYNLFYISSGLKYKKKAFIYCLGTQPQSIYSYF